MLGRPTGKLYRQENYVANILFSSDQVQTEAFNGTLFNVSGEVTICARFLVYQFVDFSLLIAVCRL